jgi:Flp pilus assembly pilin Flp
MASRLGQTAAEYALLLAGIAFAFGIGYASMGRGINRTVHRVTNAAQAAIGGATTIDLPADDDQNAKAERPKKAP